MRLCDDDVLVVLGQPERIARIMDLLHDPDRRAGDHGEQNMANPIYAMKSIEERMDRRQKLRHQNGIKWFQKRV